MYKDEIDGIAWAQETIKSNAVLKAAVRASYSYWTALSLAQQLRAVTALAEVPDSIANPAWWFTTM